MDVILQLCAGGIYLTAFITYNWQIIVGRSKPNSVTWALFSVVMTLNAITYSITSNDLVKNILPIICAAVCIFTLLFSVFNGKTTKTSNWDKAVFMVGIVAIAIWYFLKSAMYTNLILQICIIIAFCPTFISTWKNPTNEKPLPWFTWGMAYILSTLVVIIRWQGHFIDLVSPINSLILNTTVGALTFHKIK